MRPYLHLTCSSVAGWGTSPVLTGSSLTHLRKSGIATQITHSNIGMLVVDSICVCYIACCSDNSLFPEGEDVSELTTRDLATSPANIHATLGVSKSPTHPCSHACHRTCTYVCSMTWCNLGRPSLLTYWLLTRLTIVVKLFGQWKHHLSQL